MNLGKPYLGFFKAFTYNSFLCHLCGESITGIKDVPEHVEKCSNPKEMLESMRTVLKNEANWKLKFNELRSVFVFTLIGGRPYEVDECLGCETYEIHKNNGCMEFDRKQSYQMISQKLCFELRALHRQYLQSCSRFRIETTFGKSLEAVKNFKENYERLRGMDYDELAKELETANDETLPEKIRNVFETSEEIIRNHQMLLKNIDSVVNPVHQIFLSAIEALIKSDLEDFDIFTDEYVEEMNGDSNQIFDANCQFPILKNDPRPIVNKKYDCMILKGGLKKASVITTTFDETFDEFISTEPRQKRPVVPERIDHLPSHKERMLMMSTDASAAYGLFTGHRYQEIYICSKLSLLRSYALRNTYRIFGSSLITWALESGNCENLGLGIEFYTSCTYMDYHINLTTLIMSFIINRATAPMMHWISPVFVDAGNILRVEGSAELRKMYLENLKDNVERTNQLIDKIKSTPSNLDERNSLRIRSFVAYLEMRKTEHEIVLNTFRGRPGVGYNDIIEQNFTDEMFSLINMVLPVPFL